MWGKVFHYTVHGVPTNAKEPVFVVWSEVDNPGWYWNAGRGGRVPDAVVVTPV